MWSHCVVATAVAVGPVGGSATGGVPPWSGDRHEAAFSRPIGASGAEVGLWAGAQRLEAFLAGPLDWVLFDEDDARAAGNVRAELEAVGRPIGAYRCPTRWASATTWRNPRDIQRKGVRARARTEVGRLGGPPPLSGPFHNYGGIRPPMRPRCVTVPMKWTTKQATAMTISGPIDRRSPSEAKIALFRSLFRGRQDVYPRRFESRKTGRSGYAPACANEWVRGICEKPRINERRAA